MATEATRRLTVAVDVDDTVADLVGALCTRWNLKHPEGPKVRPSDMTQWDISKCVPADVAKALYEDMPHPRLYLDVAEIESARVSIDTLRARGHRVIFISSCLSGQSVAAKVSWLESHGFLPFGQQSHADFIMAHDKSMVKADVIVDDRLDNVAAWGKRGIVFGRPHNVGVVLKGEGGTPRRATGWADVVRFIDAIAEEMQPAKTTDKPSNPKDIIGSKKLPLHLVPLTAIAWECLAFLEGVLKYGRSNFRIVGVRSSIYYDAARRHIDSWFEGEDIDPESGLPHLAKARACLGVLIDAQAAGKLNDDRMVRGGYAQTVAEATPHVARLMELHAGKNPQHLTIADNGSL